MKVLFRNALIYDGTGGTAFRGDVLVSGERIIAVGEQLEDVEADIADMTGLAVAPGFIDAHSHNDWFALREQPLKYFAPFIRQGITSFVAGNCGISASGFSDSTPHMDSLGAGLFTYEGDRRRGRIAAFFDAVDGKMPCNLAALAGHNTARASVAGNSPGKLTAAERAEMLDIMDKSLKDGAAGRSLGLMYEPGLYAPLDELEDVARLCVKYDRPLTVHPRACSKVSMAYPQLLGRAHLLRAMDELAGIARGTKLKLQYSHAIFVGRQSFKYADEWIGMIDTMRQEGIDAGFDIYDETLGVSVITVVMPPWYQALSREDKRRPFNKLRFAALARASIALLGFDFTDIQIAYLGEGHERFEGKTVAQIAKELRMSEVDAYLHLCEISRFVGRVNMGPYSTPEIIKKLSKHPHVLYMTDAWVEESGIQNPALYDCFPKFLHHALQGKGDTMENTVRKMTGATADRFLLKDRGYIRPEGFADFTVFSPKELLNGTPDRGEPFGIEEVWINGHRVLYSGQLNEKKLKTSGHAMRVK